MPAFGKTAVELPVLKYDRGSGVLELGWEGKPDRKVYQITESGMEHLLCELDNPAPSHKIRSEFLATMCFADLMTPEQVQTVLDSRIADAQRNLQLIDEFESACDEDLPVGVKFTIEFGRTMLRTMNEFVEQNRHMFAEDTEKAKRSAAG